MAEGGLGMPAPILATMYQSLQKGLEAFESCRRVLGQRGRMLQLL